MSPHPNPMLLIYKECSEPGEDSSGLGEPSTNTASSLLPERHPIIIIQGSTVTRPETHAKRLSRDLGFVHVCLADASMKDPEFNILLQSGRFFDEERERTRVLVKVLKRKLNDSSGFVVCHIPTHRSFLKTFSEQVRRPDMIILLSELNVEPSQSMVSLFSAMDSLSLRYSRVFEDLEKSGFNVRKIPKDGNLYKKILAVLADIGILPLSMQSSASNDS